MKEQVPFKGAVRKTPTVKLEVIKRGRIKCTCGILAFYYTSLPSWHLPVCIINQPKTKKKKRKKK